MCLWVKGFACEHLCFGPGETGEVRSRKQPLPKRRESMSWKSQGIIPGQSVGGSVMSVSGWTSPSGGLQHEETRGQRASSEGAPELLWG